jgi:hypothetical protein
MPPLERINPPAERKVEILVIYRALNPFSWRELVENARDRKVAQAADMGFPFS